MNFAGLLDAFLGASATDTTQSRLQNVLQGGTSSQGSPLGGLGQLLGPLLGGGSPGEGIGGGGLAGLAGQITGGGNAAGSGGLGQLLGSVAGGSGQSNYGSVMPLLAGLAVAALKGFSDAPQADDGTNPPLGLRPPMGQREEQDLERNARLIIKAMITASKADGGIDQQELANIMGRLEQAGADDDARKFILEEMGRPVDLDGIVSQVDDQELAVQVYTATLLAIKVDTPAERQYVQGLARGLGLSEEITGRIEQTLGL